MSSAADLYRLSVLVVSVMRNRRPMTVGEIASAIQLQSGVKVNRRSVRRALVSNRNRFTTVRTQFKLFWPSRRWRLVETGSVDDPGNAGAPVPARPYRPTLSGAAAVALTFGELEPPQKPPTDAIGRIA